MGFFEERIDGVVTHEGQTFTCAHCGCIVRFKDNRGLFRAPTMCSYEHKPICQRCARQAVRRVGPCVNVEKRLEHIESRASILRACGIT